MLLMILHNHAGPKTRLIDHSPYLPHLPSALLLCVLLPVLSGSLSLAQDLGGGVAHLGSWSCVLYGDPAFGDERVQLRFDPDGTTRQARPSKDRARPWAPLSRWQIQDGDLVFKDSRAGRKFQGDLSRATLGGEWRMRMLVGGWWCSRMSEEEISVSGAVDEVLAGSDSTRSIIPEVMATPSYPREAIWLALEGRVLICFSVEPTGDIVEPEVLEVSDELFRGPSLDALIRSRYQGWDERLYGGRRPACRSFVYLLDPVY